MGISAGGPGSGYEKQQFSIDLGDDRVPKASGCRAPAKYVGFVTEYTLLLAVTTVTVLVLVSGLACQVMQVRGDILSPCLCSEPDQFQGVTMLNSWIGNRFVQVDTVEVFGIELYIGWEPSGGCVGSLSSISSFHQRLLAACTFSQFLYDFS